MVKTIMISNQVYEELKHAKKDKSFSEAIRNLMETAKAKTGADLEKHVGVLKEDKEYDKIMGKLRPLYKKWTKKYA